MSIDLRRYLPQYFEESAACLVQLAESLEGLAQGWDGALADKASRAAHCIKGNSGAFGFNEVGALAAELDYSLRQARHGYGNGNTAFLADCRTASALLAELLHAREQGQIPDAAAALQAGESLRQWQACGAERPDTSDATRSGHD